MQRCGSVEVEEERGDVNVVNALKSDCWWVSESSTCRLVSNYIHHKRKLPHDVSVQVCLAEEIAQ